MQLFRHLENLPTEAKGAVVAWGNFDGFHKGHQAVLQKAADIARELDAPLAVLTTEPHPRQFFKPDAPPFRLMSLRTKAQTIESFGADFLYVLTFDAALAGTEADVFVRDVLVGALRARHIVTGYDQRFGKGRKGDADLLQEMGATLGFDVTVVDPLSDGGEIYSSTGIRELLRAGKPREAARLLGHWWQLEGRVEEGDQRGRTIGFPTANLRWQDHLEPTRGVYAVRVTIETGPHAGRYNGVANLGMRPTFNKEELCFEIHIFDFEGDIYGEHVAADMIDFIRPEMKFDGLESLKAQIAADSETASKILAEAPATPE